MLAPFLNGTGQVLKIFLGVVLMVAGFTANYGTGQGWWGKQTNGQFFLLETGGIVLTLGSFIWMNWSIRCPQCQTKLFWRAVSEKAHPHGLNSLWSMEKCPSCGFRTSTMRLR